ncbi:hypothetical protein MRB53_024204 [Persea americana]|uniref:Uncharacterized protein n=1 Tax=Persea americana TaxID=3435 RepID=A0ACC2LBL2_PERAE|nr:hypothetical protein MRB53_024204 [Persea americana]
MISVCSARGKRAATALCAGRRKKRGGDGGDGLCRTFQGDDGTWAEMKEGEDGHCTPEEKGLSRDWVLCK